MSARKRLFAGSFIVALLSACNSPQPPLGAYQMMSSGSPGPSTAGQVVDDMSDGDNRILEAGNRGGYWYTYKDAVSTVWPATGVFQMSAPGRGDADFAARMTGTLGPGGTLYVGMGFSFTEPKAMYDATLEGACAGLRFWVRAGTFHGATPLRLKMPDANTDPDGGVCTNCYDDHGFDVTVAPSEWSLVEIPFADMTQEGWGSPRASFEPARAYGIQWQVNRPSGAAIDLWVDDIALF